MNIDIKAIREQAFRAIMDNPELRDAWNNALHQSERDELMLEEVYKIAYDAGYWACWQR